MVYNGVTYNSSGIFYGVANITAVTSKSDNAVLYEVTDLANARTIDIRVSSAPFSGNITEGKLALGYWYFIEANDLNNPSGSITYNRFTPLVVPFFQLPMLTRL